MKAGITIIVENDRNIFSNGICQNVLLMQELLEKCSNIDECFIVNIKETPIEKFKGTFWESFSHKFITRAQALERCDLLIVAHGFISAQEVHAYRSRGKKVVKHVMGAAQSIFNERILFYADPSGVYPRMKLDAVWVSPHFYERDKFFLESMHDCPIYLGNYIWDPRFIEDNAAQIGFTGYTPSGSISKRLSTAEPNLNMVKTCVVPLTIAEMLERKSPEYLSRLAVFCGNRVKDKKDMIQFAGNLDVHRNKKCVFLPRYPLVGTLKLYTDIMVCHQNQCELNYLYLDTAWLGYPLLHNSPMMKELGWYYHENDVDGAIKHLEYIANNFDAREYPNNRYRNRSREFAKRYLIENNIHHYEWLVDEVLRGNQT